MSQVGGRHGSEAEQVKVTREAVYKSHRSLGQIQHQAPYSLQPVSYILLPARFAYRGLLCHFVFFLLGFQGPVGPDKFTF